VSRGDAHPTTVPRATVALLYQFLAIAIFLGSEVASNRSFGSSPQGTAEVPVHGLRLIGPSRPPGDPAHLDVPGHRTGLSVSRRVDPAVRKTTKVATQYGTPRGWGRPGIGTMPSQNQEVRPEMVSGTFFRGSMRVREEAGRIEGDSEA